jgi:hypothetical protein
MYAQNQPLSITDIYSYQLGPLIIYGLQPAALLHKSPFWRLGYD